MTPSFESWARNWQSYWALIIFWCILAMPCYICVLTPSVCFLQQHLAQVWRLIKLGLLSLVALWGCTWIFLLKHLVFYSCLFFPFFFSQLSFSQFTYALPTWWFGELESLSVVLMDDPARWWPGSCTCQHAYKIPCWHVTAKVFLRLLYLPNLLYCKIRTGALNRKIKGEIWVENLYCLLQTCTSHR